MEKHFTVTGFVVHGDKTLLLWHPLMQGWAPAGGHVEPNEDPTEAVVREIREEAAPVTILLENSFEPGERHEHVDFIYFCALLGEPPPLPHDERHLTWVGEEQLRRGEPLPLGDGRSAKVAEDVRLLALRAIAKSRESGRAAPQGG
jgi:ADP-ribose pyrophosphatase YjhB (NUDIX family)